MGSENPYYDEDIDEVFTGPYNAAELDEEDEAYDDDYETESANLFNDGVFVPPSGDGLSSLERGAGSGHTHSETQGPNSD